MVWYWLGWDFCSFWGIFSKFPMNIPVTCFMGVSQAIYYCKEQRGGSYQRKTWNKVEGWEMVSSEFTLPISPPTQDAHWCHEVSFLNSDLFNILRLQKKLQESITLLKQFENGTLPQATTDRKVGIVNKKRLLHKIEQNIMIFQGWEPHYLLILKAEASDLSTGHI